MLEPLTMNAYAVPPIMAALLNVAMAIWIFLQVSPSPIRATFLMWTSLVGLWNLSIAGGYLMGDAPGALWWYRNVVATFVRFLAPFFLQFVMAVTESGKIQRNRRVLYLSYACSLGFLAVGLGSPLLIREVRHFFWGYYPLAERGEILFAIPFLATIGWAFFLLYKTAREASGYRRRQLSWLLAGAAVGFGGGATNFFPLYGISLYPVGNLLNSLYSVLVAYAIIEYRLLDIRIVLRRGTVYALLSGSLTAVYLSLVAVLQRLFGHYGVQESVAFYTAAFPMTVVLAPAMKDRIEPFVEHALFKNEDPRRGAFLKTHNVALMGVLATEVAHELAKPLTHIMNVSSLLGNHALGHDKEGLQKIEKEAQRAAEILDGFALLSPDRTLHQIAVPLEDLLEESLTTLGLEEDRTIQIKRRYGVLTPIFVNPGQIVQVFTNIIQNAWQAMREGGMLTLSLEEAASGGAPMVAVLIEDTGPGIPARDLERVFEPFFTTKRARGGRGVGLTISQAMVERHGGQIVIESPLGPQGGTRVRITLPMKQKETSHAV